MADYKDFELDDEREEPQVEVRGLDSPVPVSDYSDFQLDVERADTSRANIEMAPSVSVSAERHALSRDTGLPVSVIPGMEEQARGMQAVQRADLEGLASRAPKTHSLVQDPERAALVRDSVSTLTQAEQSHRQLKETVRLNNLPWYKQLGHVLFDTEETVKGVEHGVHGARVMTSAVGALLEVTQLEQLRTVKTSFDDIDKGLFTGGRSGAADPRVRRYSMEQDPDKRAEMRRALAHDLDRAMMEKREQLKDVRKLQAAQKSSEPGRVQEFTKISSLLDFVDFVKYSSGQAATYMVGSIASGAVSSATTGTPVPGLMGFGYAMGVGDIYAELIDQEREGETERALIGGVPYAAVELIGVPARAMRPVVDKAAREFFRRAGKPLPKNAAQAFVREATEAELRALTREMSETAVEASLRGLPRSMAEEFINEAGQEIVKDISVKAGTDQEIFTSDALLAWFNAGMAGAFGGAPFSVASDATRTVLTNRSRERTLRQAKAQEDQLQALQEAQAARMQYVQEQGTLEGWVNNTREDTLFQASPDAYVEQLAEVLSEDGAEQQVYLDVAEAQTFFQSEDAPMSMDEFAAAVTEVREQLTQAQELGGDLVLPASKVVSFLARNEQLSGLMDKMRLSMESSTQASYQAQVEAVLGPTVAAEQEQESLTRRAEEHEDRFAGQLKAAGFSRNYAKQYAAALRSFYETQSQRLAGNETALEVLERRVAGLAALRGTDSIGVGAREYEQIVYHGSPHNFTRFSTEAMGTGEGVQMYGWGTYFAEERAVADTYAPRDFDYEEQLMAAYKAAEARENFDAMEVYEAAMLHRYPYEIAELMEGRAEEAQDHVKELMEASSSFMYTVDLPDHLIENMLDWDAPFSEQTVIKELLLEAAGLTDDVVEEWREKLMADLQENGPPAYADDRLERVIQEYLDYQEYGPEFGSGVVDELREAAPEVADDFIDFVDSSGLGGIDADDPGGTAYTALSSMLGSQQAASQKLLEAGIPGIKYLDGNSRQEGEGTYNYVVFDPSSLRITEKNAGSLNQETTEFFQWFGDSQVVDTTGQPKVMYRGDYRDVGDTFRVVSEGDVNEGSGGVYFTDNPEIASSYAEGKRSFDEDEEGMFDPNNLVKVRVGMRRMEGLVDAGRRLNAKQRATLKRVFMSYGENPENDYMSEFGLKDNTAIGEHIWEEYRRRHQGNVLHAAWELFVNGALGTTEEFMQGLELAGIKGHYLDPHEGAPVVTPVYLRAERPVDLRAMLHDERAALIEALEEDGPFSPLADSLRNYGPEGHHHEETMSFITDKDKEVMLRMGYDSIRDVGGHNIGTSEEDLHDVWIVFEPTQIKSAIGNRGTFAKDEPSILFQDRVQGLMDRLRGRAQQTDVTLPGDVEYDQAVYHGSPHVFDEFDLSKIGTGEGAQGFGWGAYVAERRGVAQRYTDDEGNLYTVELDDDAIPQMLDWDAPLTQQQDAVKDNLVATGLWSGEMESRNWNGQALYRNLTTSLGSQEMASKMLDAAGIPGIKYFDGVSRRRQEGTRNYVVFDEAHLEIRDRNGEPVVLEQNRSSTGRRGSIQFSNDTSLLRIFEDADPSTVLHELGHFFLETQKAIHESGVADGSWTADYNALLSWLGSDGTFTRDQHEKFARTFEQYARSGVAPSIRLKRAFQNFKRWLVQVYRNAKALNADMDDTIRDLMDRMLATDEEITELSAQPTFAKDDNFLKYLTEAERKAYLLRLSRQSETARERLLTKALKQTERNATQEWKELREAALREVDEDIAQRPVYQAIYFMQTGKLLGREFPEGYEVERTQINYGIAEQMYGAQALKALPRGVLTKKGGAHPDAMADHFGFPSGADLIIAMREAVPRAELRQQEADELMVKRHGDMLHDGSIEQQALEAMESQDRTRLLLYEAQVLARKAGKPAAVREQLQVRAEEILGAMPLGEILKNAHSYYRAEVKAAAKAGRHLSKGNFELAAQAKQQQILNHMLYRQATAAREQTAKDLKRFRKLVKPQSKGKVRIDEDYHEKIVQILNAYNLGSRMTAATQDRITKEALLQWAAQKESNDNAVFITPDKLLQSQKTNWRELSLEEWRELAAVIENIEAQGRMKRTILVDGQRMELADVTAEMVESVTTKGSTRKWEPQPRETVPAARRAMEQYLLMHTRARTLIKKLDGWQPFGAAYKYLMRDVDAAANERERRMKDVAADMEDLFKRSYGKSLRSLSRMRERFYVEELGTSLTREGLVAIALNMGNSDNANKLVGGYEKRGWTHNAVRAALEAHLNETDLALVNDIWEYIDSFWPEIAELEKRTTGVTPAKVPAEPFELTLADGTVVSMRGGYYPLVADSEQSGGVVDQDAQSIEELMRTGRFATAQTARGHTKARVEHKGQPVRLDMGVLFSHVQQVVTDLTMREAIESAYKVVKHNDVREAIEDTAGVQTHKYLRWWLEDVAKNNINSGEALTRGLDNLRAGVSIAVMGFKFTTIAVQLTGYTHSLVQLGPKYAMKGFMRYFGGMARDPRVLVKGMQMVLDKSKTMRDRSTTFHRDVNDALRTMQRKGLIRGAVAKAGFWPIVKMQMQVDSMTWLGAYEKAHDMYADEFGENLDGLEERAIEFADAAVIETQGSGLMKDLSAIERGSMSETTRLTSALRLFTVFQSYFITKFNLAYERGAMKDLKKPTDVATLAAEYAMMFWVEAVIAELILDRMPDFEDDEKSAEWWAFKLLAANVTGMLVGMREISGAVQGFGGSPAGLRGLDSIGKALGQIGGAVEDFHNDEDINTYGLAKSVISAAGIVTKVPVEWFNQILRGMKQEDEHGNATLYDYLRYNQEYQ